MCMYVLICDCLTGCLCVRAPVCGVKTLYHTHTLSHTQQTLITTLPLTHTCDHRHVINAKYIHKHMQACWPSLYKRNPDSRCHIPPRHFILIRAFSNSLHIGFWPILSPDSGVSRHFEPRHVHNLYYCMDEKNFTFT